MSITSSFISARSLGSWQVFVAGVALVVASSTLVSDFTGFISLGVGFTVALLFGFGINALLALSAADLAASHPQAGALYAYARNILPGRSGRLFAVFLGLSFYGMFALCASGETNAGAMGLQALLGPKVPLWLCTIGLMGIAVIVNLYGLKAASWLSAVLLFGMLGIRWAFGLVGFTNLAEVGPWEWSNLVAGSSSLTWFGENGILSTGLALGFWSFVGIEFACSLAEEVRHPEKSLPRSMLAGLGVILATSLVMGLGSLGGQPLSFWQAQLAESAFGNGGESPQLVVGEIFFGGKGRVLMAVASVSAMLGTMTIAIGAMSRLLYSLARDGALGSAATRKVGRLHPHRHSPVAAILLTGVLFTLPAVVTGAVVDWIYSAAYVWILLYLVYHVLAILNRMRYAEAPRAVPSGIIYAVAGFGLATTALVLVLCFQGSHLHYGARAAIVLALAFAGSLLSQWRTTTAQPAPVSTRI